MFKFTLPQFAALNVSLPTGGTIVMVHMGDGEFCSLVPPLAVPGILPEGVAVPAEYPVVPVTWATGAFVGDVNTTGFGFDVAGAAASVEQAAAAGDVVAGEIVSQMKEAEVMLAAREKLGLVASPYLEQ